MLEFAGGRRRIIDAETWLDKALSGRLERGDPLPQLAVGEALDGFALGMRAVRAAFDAVVPMIENGRWRESQPVQQDKALEMRCSRKRDFTDDIAADYLERQPAIETIQKAVNGRDLSRFVLPKQYTTMLSRARLIEVY